MKRNNSDHPLLFKMVMLAAGLLTGFLSARIFFTVVSVNSSSMEPSIQNGDTAVIYNFGKAEKGNITAMENPSDKESLLLLRIIAVENDTVEIKNRIIYINDSRFVPPWPVIRTSTTELPMKFCSRDNMAPVRLGRNEVFLIGDNFDKSFDSRIFGKVNTGNLKGKVIYRHKF